jgi:excisionase family DNA binding protein
VEELLTIDELAGRLKVSPWTIRAWVAKRFVPFFKLGGLVRFRSAEVEVWLRQKFRAGRSVYKIRKESEISNNLANSTFSP